MWATRTVMASLTEWVARLKGLFGRGRSDNDLHDDIQAHLDLLTEEYVRRGLTPDDARTAAHRSFGGIEQVKEAYRDRRGFTLLDDLAGDVRLAFRVLRGSPGFSAVAIGSLALAIGASTAAFSVFNAVMLRPLAVQEPEALVLLQALKSGKRFVLFNPTFEALRERQRTLSGLFAVNDHPYLKVTFDDVDVPTYVRGSLVSGTYFHVLGVVPSVGRLLAESDDVVAGANGEAACSAVISHNLWMRRFDRRADIVGRTLRVRASVCSIVGVASASFAGHQSGFSPDVWLPLRPLTDRQLLESPRMAFFSGVMGRLAPGARLTQAEAELTSLYQAIRAGQPLAPSERPTDYTIGVVPGAQGLDTVRRAFGTPLTIAIAVVGVVWLIAALNVANLLLARGAARLPELATRAALGASRMRLVRQSATEGGVLAGLGGLLGVCLASAAAPVLASSVSLSYTTIVLDTGTDRRVLAAAVSLTILTTVLVGALPAWRLTRMALLAAIGGETRTTVGGGQGLTRSLVAVQLALSLFLLASAGLLLRTIVNLAGIDAGFRPEHVVMLDVRDETPGSSFGMVDSAEQKMRRAALYRTLDENLNGISGVQASSVSWLGLFSSNDLGLTLIDPDQPGNRSGSRVDYVSWRYFRTVGMHIVQGRDFTDQDREGTGRVAVVNETLARTRFGGNALGRRLALDYAGEQDRPFTVVGVVRDSKYNNLRETRSAPMLWVPIVQASFKISSVALKVEPGREADVRREAEAVVSATDKELMVRKATTLSTQVDQTTARERLLVRLSAGFGGLAVMLAAIGLYGTLAYAVKRRTREIGVRMACGAGRRAVLSMVLTDALRLIAVALVVGVPLALGSGYALQAFLFGVTPLDPMTFAGACAVLTIVALLAAYIPARRAAAVDPMVALRWD